MIRLPVVEVEISRCQATTFSGRTLGYVKIKGDFLVVNKKRKRGTKFDNHYFSMKDVIAYVEGKGGDSKNAVAYAVVKTNTILRSLIGTVNMDNGKVIVTDERGVAHHINIINDESHISIVHMSEEQESADVFKDPGFSHKSNKSTEEFVDLANSIMNPKRGVNIKQRPRRDDSF